MFWLFWVPWISVRILGYTDFFINKLTWAISLSSWKISWNISWYNDKKLCAKKVDVDNNLYTKTNDGLLVACSNLIKDCEKCTDTDTCFQCQDGAGLTNNDSCINTTLVEEKHDYYKDENTNTFISCLTLGHCLTCISSSVCTSCKEGFTLGNNKCEKNEENKDDGGLSTGAIIGIVGGCLLFLLLLLLIFYLHHF